MKITTNHYAYQNGRDLCEYTLENDNGMQVKLLNYGATIEQILLPAKNGKKENVIMSLPSPQDYSKERNFLGGTVGRIVGRVRKGQWKHGNQILQLPLNDGNNHIHGGTGIDTMVWDARLTLNQEAGFALITFSLFDPDGHNGYPGNMHIEASYDLDNDNTLSYNIYAVSDQLTLFNPTNHIYFRLDGPKSNVEDLELQINADYYLPLDQESLPYQGMKAVDNTVFDFRKPTKLATVLNSNDPEILREHGLNHPFILNAGFENIAKIISHKNKRQMTMSSNAPSVVVYTANHFNHSGIAQSLGQFDGITLEAQVPPAPNSNLGAITLVPGDSFNRQTSWHFDF